MLSKLMIANVGRSPFRVLTQHFFIQSLVKGVDIFEREVLQHSLARCFPQVFTAEWSKLDQFLHCAGQRLRISRRYDEPSYNDNPQQVAHVRHDAGNAAEHRLTDDVWKAFHAAR